MEHLSQAAALMLTGMSIVFGMLIALIGVIALNARLVRYFNLDHPTVKPGETGVPAITPPVAAIITAAIQAHEDFHNNRPQRS